MKFRLKIFTLIILLPFLLIAQTEDEPSEAKSSPFSMGGGVGTIVMNGKTYSQFRLMPEITLGKIGIGLDIDILIDEEGQVREEDWDDWKDYVNKVYYIRYGYRGDPIYGKIGGFLSYSLGPGLVMKNYSNMLRYPEHRQIGLQLGGKLPFAKTTVEAFTSSITENEILAGRVTAQLLSKSQIPLLKNMVFGGTFAHDRNQYKGLLDNDDDNYPNVYDDYPDDEDWHNEVDYNEDYWRDIYTEINGDTTGFNNWFQNSDILPRNSSFADLGENDVSVFGVDYKLPLISKKLFTLGHYAEASKIIDHGMGFIFPGFYSKFLIFDANLEFRYYQEDFTAAFFDHLYEQQRASVYGDSVLLKEDLLANTEETKGWFGSLQTNILNFLIIKVSYEDMYGKESNNRSIWGTARLEQKIIPKLTTAEINYSQTRFEKLEHFKTPSALLEGKAGYSLGGNTVLVAKYQERYQDLNNDGEIEGKVNGESETIKTFGMGVEFKF